MFAATPRQFNARETTGGDDNDIGLDIVKVGCIDVAIQMDIDAEMFDFRRQPVGDAGDVLAPAAFLGEPDLATEP